MTSDKVPLDIGVSMFLKGVTDLANHFNHCPTVSRRCLYWLHLLLSK